MFNEVHTFSPTLVNDFRFNYQPRFFLSKSEGVDDPWPSQLGLRGVGDRSFPRVNVAGITSLGAATAERLQTPIVDNHLVNAANWFKGSHSVHFGGEIRWSRNAEDLNSEVAGTYGFAVQGTTLTFGVNGRF